MSSRRDRIIRRMARCYPANAFAANRTSRTLKRWVKGLPHKARGRKLRFLERVGAVGPPAGLPLKGPEDMERYVAHRSALDTIWKEAER